MKKISIIILNWNSWKETFECLDSILKTNKNFFHLEIILVDNASSSSFDEKLREYAKKSKERNINLAFIQNKENLGFAGGNNIGIKKALENKADFILILNNDTIVDKNLVINLLKSSEKDEKDGVIGAKIYFAKGYEFHKDRYKKDDLGKIIWFAGGIIDWNNVYSSHRGVDEVDVGQYDKRIETDFVTGCCMFVKREVFEKVGFFDEKYFLYLEDADLSMRAKKTGYRLIYEPKAFLWHKNAQSSGKPGSKTHEYYQTRNRLLFGFKYTKLRTKISLLKEGLKFIVNGGIKRKAVFDFLTCNFGKGNL